jgi:hypothetical protein
MTVPTANDHLVQARANREHAEWLLVSRPTDPTALQWAVTAIFYSALHGLTAHLMGHGVTVTSHRARTRALLSPSYGVPTAVYDTYRDLDLWSRGARYGLWVFTAQDVRDLLDQELATIATFAGM